MARMLDTRTKTVRIRVATQGEINWKQARDWAIWAAGQCGVSPTIIQAPQPCRWQMLGVFRPSRGVSHRGARARNCLYRDKHRETYLKRCRVAHFMHTVPNPLFDAVASHPVIASGMGFSCSRLVSHAIMRWEGIRGSQNGSVT